MPADRTVCIVDDDEAVRDSLEVLFDAEGFTVATFASARDFLEGGPARACCLVTDVRMPEMSGLELLAALAERPDPPPVIMITGHGDVPMAVRAMKLGAADFIEKPFDAQLLVARVREALRAGPAEPGAAALRAKVQSRLEQLTPREREVLTLVIEGLPSQNISRGPESCAAAPLRRR